ncbi:MAG: methyltransferase domain-containing protein [Acidimicrobiia bacterium]
MRRDVCSACGRPGLTSFYRADTLPTQTCVLLDGEEEARRYPTGDLELAVCAACGLIQNVLFDPSLVDYSKPTEESQAFSPKFQAFASSLAERLVAEHDLKGCAVLEIGCGKGDFMMLLAECGIGRGLGIDPGYLPNRPEVADADIEFRRDWYDPESVGLPADLVLTRHLMEHVPNVGQFLGWLAESTRGTEGAVLFTEVPDVRRVLDEGAFWDVYYEHCSYFTRGSLARAIAATGLRPTDVWLDFDDQYILSEAVAGSGEPWARDDLGETLRAAESFGSIASEAVEKWRDEIASRIDRGLEVAVWGGGSKAVAFLTTIGIDGVSVVDINPHKQGKWLPTVAVEVQSPRILEEIRPDLVIPMNAIYVDEIRRDLQDLGLKPTIAPL